MYVILYDCICLYSSSWPKLGEAQQVAPTVGPPDRETIAVITCYQP